MSSNGEASEVGSPWWETWVAALRPYAVLLHLFIDNAIGAREFEVLFLRLYKDDPTEWPSEVFRIIDAFFADVDSYCADDKLGERVHGIDAQELRARAEDTFAQLQEIAG
jgi:Bacterial self-protective colicin-like immunity